MARPHIRYLCVDDESPERLAPLLERLRSAGIDVHLAYPQPFDEEVDAICRSRANGVILDLRLDNVASVTNGSRVRYRALSLAQELRTRMTEGAVMSFPIVLWSVERKFQQSYAADRTGHDLFDLVISKDDVGRAVEGIAPKLRALASDYPRLKRDSGSLGRWRGRLLGLSVREQKLIDPRVIEELSESVPDHERARFIVSQVLERPGILVHEGLLAARLGVDPLSPDWAGVKAFFDAARYSGVFAAGWPRWWWPTAEAKWRSLTGLATLRSLTAGERVGVLKKVTQLRRIRAAVPVGSVADRFWHVCAALDIPIDPVDSVITVQSPPKPWQDQEYVSVEAALTRQASGRGYRIDPLEHSRLAGLVEARQLHGKEK